MGFEHFQIQLKVVGVWPAENHHLLSGKRSWRRNCTVGFLGDSPKIQSKYNETFCPIQQMVIKCHKWSQSNTLW